MAEHYSTLVEAEEAAENQDVGASGRCGPLTDGAGGFLLGVPLGCLGNGDPT
jgi:hypothetical protein